MTIHETQIPGFGTGTGFDGSSTPFPARAPLAVQAPPLPEWLQALPTVQNRLEAGARVADVVCGAGNATVMLTRAFPRAQIFGYDLREPAIRAARQAALEAGVIRRAYFATASPADFPGWNYDLVTFLNGLVHLPNPGAAARRVRTALAPDASWVILEPAATASQVPEIAATAGFSAVRRVAQVGAAVVFEVRV